MEPIGSPPYIVSPPEVIPIDVGRQLFVDDFIIEEASLKRSFHSAEYYSGNPVFDDIPYSDGIWYDPRDNLFKMWYSGRYAASGVVRYATSRDGIHWEKPSLDVVSGTNIVFLPEIRRDETTVWLDLEEKDPSRRYKMFVYLKKPAEYNYCSVHFSADGIHWGESVARSGRCGDTTNVFWNPFRKVWVYSAKDPHMPGRKDTIRIKTGALKGKDQRVKRRLYWEARDLIRHSMWTNEEIPYWVGADRLDPPRPDLNIPTMLYRLNCVAYESLILGLFTIWHGQYEGRPKINDLVAGFSRDGFHWDRTNREPLITVSEDDEDWNWGNVSSVGGCCLIVGDKLYFYASGRARKNDSFTGLATLRRDGFASMDAGASEASLTTRPISFKGKYLFVNVDAPQGELRAEVLDERGQVIQPFTRENCASVSADRTLQTVSWKGVEDLSKVSGRTVKLRFHLRSGRLYAFWVSPARSGASYGYVAAGGPGFTGPKDTIGNAALPHR